MIDRPDVIALICETIRGLDTRRFRHDPHPLGEETSLIGDHGFLDSLGLVHLLMDVEMQVNDLAATPVSIVDERALSQSRSPFRTIGTLADHVVSITRG
jgi:acyl carrier protein